MVVHDCERIRIKAIATSLVNFEARMNFLFDNKPKMCVILELSY